MKTLKYKGSWFIVVLLIICSVSNNSLNSVRGGSQGSQASSVSSRLSSLGSSSPRSGQPSSQSGTPPLFVRGTGVQLQPRMPSPSGPTAAASSRPVDVAASSRSGTPPLPRFTGQDRENLRELMEKFTKETARPLSSRPPTAVSSQSGTPPSPESPWLRSPQSRAASGQLSAISGGVRSARTGQLFLLSSPPIPKKENPQASGQTNESPRGGAAGAGFSSGQGLRRPSQPSPRR